MKSSTRGLIAGIEFLASIFAISYGMDRMSSAMLKNSYAKGRETSKTNGGHTKWVRIGKDVSQQEANEYFEAFLRRMQSVDRKVDELKHYEDEQSQLHEEWETLQRVYSDKFFNFIVE